MWKRKGGLLWCTATWLLQIAVLSLSSPASSVLTSEHGKACLSHHGPDIAILHPPDGFLVEDPAKLMVAFYVSSFCVSRLGDNLKVVAAPSALPSPRSAPPRLALPHLFGIALLTRSVSPGSVLLILPRAASLLSFS